jgi:cupin superfamily acireductone dioxygenase involved in methionine salvage
MLKRFSSEHWHDEDEVRLIVEGRGLFHIHPQGRPVFALEVEAGDLIRVPRGTHHWFDLCGRAPYSSHSLFQDRRVDTALHRERRGREVPAAVLRAGLHSGRARGSGIRV